MFDFLRNLTKSAEDKRQEAVAAYLDGALNDRERQRFEQEMAQDASLQAEVEQLRLIKQSLRQLPQRLVPRNFVLNPADYRRPAPQPWVQAYPVLRTATALAAFFFIFAVVAGTFTGFGTGDSPASSLAPVADVAQVEEMEADESIEVTRVVTELTESFAAEADADDAAEDTTEEAAGEALAAEPEAEIQLEAEEMAEEESVEEEMMEEAAPPAPEATQPAMATTVPETADSLQSDAAVDGESAPAPLMTATPAPTATASTLPRVTPTPPLPEREAELAEEDLGESEESEEAVADTAVANDSTDRETGLDQPADPLPWLQIGLGLLLLLLAGLTFYARRQR